MSATATGSMIRREIDDDRICVLTFDRPESGANIFDAPTMTELSEHVAFLENEPTLKGLVITSAKKSIFIAGADLKTLMRQAASGEMRSFIGEGQRVFNRLSSLKIPTCAAIHGACAGGGYEITLACDYRVASNDPATKIGLPETTLGLVPAWGGATRLPRLIGTEKATEVILKGKLFSAAEAKELGLVDDVVSREQLLETARTKIRAGKKPPSPHPLPEGEAEGKAASEGQRSAVSKSEANPAPARAREIISKTLRTSIENSLQMELDAIVDLGEMESTRNLIRNFFLADKYRKGSSKTPVEKVVHAAVIGAGVMGSGITQWLSSRGVSVILRDVNSDAIDRGLANVDKTYADAVKRGLMSAAKAKEGRARIVASTAPVEMRTVQIVIEAASEKLEIKKQIFTDLSAKTGPNAILATNTSALPIGELAGSTKSPERVIGLHFFNPVSRMKLVEVVVGKQTAAETTDRALAFTRQIGKLPVLVQDSPGFLVNRVLFPYLLEAAQLYENGASANEIDDALVQWGMPMGPLRLIDEIGVDITVDIANTLEKAYGERARSPQILRKMQDAKMLGRKSGSGFYKYEGKQQSPNESLEQWRLSAAGHPERSEGPHEPGEREVPPTARNGNATDIALRLIFLMVNEAARCLEEKVVARAEDADYGMILGTGFAPFRGGPLRFADHFGIAEMVRAGDRHGGKFKPCDLLRQRAEKGTKFYEN